jgi:hypothetical protein
MEYVLEVTNESPVAEWATGFLWLSHLTESVSQIISNRMTLSHLMFTLLMRKVWWFIYVGCEVLNIGGYKKYCRLGYNTVYSIESQCWYFSQPIRPWRWRPYVSSKRQLTFQWTTWRYIPKGMYPTDELKQSNFMWQFKCYVCHCRDLWWVQAIKLSYRTGGDWLQSLMAESFEEVINSRKISDVSGFDFYWST